MITIKKRKPALAAPDVYSYRSEYQSKHVRRKRFPWTLYETLIGAAFFFGGMLFLIGLMWAVQQFDVVHG